MNGEPRWDLINKIPDDLLIYGGDNPEGQWTWTEWRTELGHPYADGHGFCKTCGAGGPCILHAFFDAVTVSTVRALDRLGALVPAEKEGS